MTNFINMMNIINNALLIDWEDYLMIYKKLVVLLLLITLLNSSSCGLHDERAQSIFTNFSNLIENGDYENLRLTIFFSCPLHMRSHGGRSFEDLKSEYYEGGGFVQKFVIEGNELAEYINLFHQFNDFYIKPTYIHPILPDARIYYFFENILTGYTFEVIIENIHFRLFVNRVEVEWNEIFYDIILPFLPEDIIETIEIALNRRPFLFND